jgi:hypothetical protein
MAAATEKAAAPPLMKAFMGAVILTSDVDDDAWSVSLAGGASGISRRGSHGPEADRIRNVLARAHIVDRAKGHCSCAPQLLNQSLREINGRFQFEQLRVALRYVPRAAAA